MDKQAFTSRQAICVLTVFILGSSVVLGGFSDTEQDSWLCIVLSQVFVIPILFVYARIIKLYPEKNIYEIAEILFGKSIGKIIDVLFIWYSIHLAALVLRNFSEFIEIVAMPETPQLPIMLIIVLVAAYLTKSGAKVLGKWAVISLTVIFSFFIITVALLFPQMNFANFFPVINHSTKAIFSGAYNMFAYPFAETVLFLTIADFLKKEDSPFKIYLIGEIIGALILFLVVLRNIASIGPKLMKAEYFPSYISARIISVSDFLTRIEGSISTNFVFAGVTKITLCLFAASKGLANLFQIQDYKKMILPVSLISVALSCILYSSTMEMINFLKVYVIYVIPFQIFIPIIIWLGCEIKTRFKKTTVQST
ncbi:MAG TPA: endospore germination permease [Oscillospiraceae bacterium]|nr:endospore germination permease [Oscillospiraceae bacterium]